MAKMNVKLKLTDFKYRLKNEQSTDEKMSTKEIWSYGMTDFGINLSSLLVRDYIKVFFMLALGVDPVTTGVIVAVTGIVEFFRDPILSILTDSTKTRWGRFRPYVIIFAPITALLSVVVFVNPFDASDSLMLPYIYISYLLWSTASSLTGIAWAGLQQCVTKNGEERKKYFSIGKALNIISGMLPALLPIAIDIFRAQGWSLRGLFIGAAMIICIMGFAACTFAKNLRERIMIEKAESPFKNIKTVFKNKYTILFWFKQIGSMFNYVGWGVAPYMFLYNYGGYTWQTFVWGIGGIAGWIGLFLSAKIFKILSPKTTIMLYNMMLSVGYAVLYFLGYSSLMPILIVAFAVNFFTYVSSVSESIISTETFDYIEWKTGIRNEATTGMVSGIIGKIFAAVNAIVLGYVLAGIGFQSGNVATQSVDTMDKMFFCYTILNAVGAFLSTIPYLFYDLDATKVKRMREEIEQRKHAAEHRPIIMK